MTVQIRVKNYAGYTVFEDIYPDVTDYSEALTEMTHDVFICDGDIIEIDRVDD